ncbi:hypothetical protein Q604_UNBC13571G0001, partial [human gut metagenome]
QALLPLLLKSDAGSLVFTSSSVGRQGRANWGAYAASKFATEGMMQVLADEYQQRLRDAPIPVNEDLSAFHRQMRRTADHVISARSDDKRRRYFGQLLE